MQNLVQLAGSRLAFTEMTPVRLAPWLLRTFTLLLLAACGSDAPTAAQNQHPGGSGGPVVIPGAPVGWLGSIGAPFGAGLDETDHRGGRAALYLTAVNPPLPPSTPSFVTVNQGIRADLFRGKRIRLAGWVRQVSLNCSECGLWMRIDGPGVTLGFDNMSDRPLTGTADWHQVSIVLDVPTAAIGITFGALSNGTGTLLVDDLSLDTVGSDVAITSPPGPPPPGSDSATLVARYARTPSSPVNLDFEGIANTPPATVAWLASNAVPLATTDPTASLDDLQPLEQIVGSAHLVGMGEGTHGTRQFFQMKHRILKYLVTKLGFTVFAIEATSPEADDLNRYVLTGEGNPKTLLSRLYFWTWNTQEVLDMIEWMRQWNAGAAPSQRVQFLGFDMQTPGASMDSVAAFIGRVDPGQSNFVANRYACLAPYRNHGPTPGASASQYALSSPSTKADCAAGLQAVHDLIQSSSAAYQAASSPAVYQQTLHHARLVQEYETMISLSNAQASSLSRDRAMAENIDWIRQQASTGAKIALWAHNGHINAVPQLMGGYLRASYGADYLPLGFAFGTGGFNAVGSAGLRAWEASIIPKGSLESAFLATGKPMLLLDTRKISSGGAAAAPLTGPIAMRSIGAVFDPNFETAYFGQAIFPDDFSVLVFLATTTPSTLLPFSF
jgi:erythromycin esterase